MSDRSLPARLALEIAHSYDLDLHQWKDEIREGIMTARAQHGRYKPAVAYFDDYMHSLAYRWGEREE